MKVTVKVDSTSKSGVGCTLAITVNSTETVSSVKERIASVQSVTFPDQDLVFGGEVLEDGLKLIDCGVKEGDSLGFVIKASEATLAQQLVELLQAKDVSLDELKHMYSHKYGVGVDQALKALGHSEGFPDFVSNQKAVVLKDGLVTAANKNTLADPKAATDEPATAALVEQLSNLLRVHPLALEELGLLYCYTYGVTISQALKAIGREGEKLQDFLAGRPGFALKGIAAPGATACREDAVPSSEFLAGCPSFVLDGIPESEDITVEHVQEEVAALYRRAQKKEVAAEERHRRCLEMHAKSCSRDFSARVARTLDMVVTIILETAFFDVHHIVKGGAVGRGTAVPGSADAEVVLFLNGLPPAGRDRWLPGLLNSMAASLEERLCDTLKVKDFSVVGDALQVKLLVDELEAIEIRVSPVFETHTKALKTFCEQKMEDRGWYVSSLAEKKALFIKRQPEPVKVTMRLLKLWRERQTWSSALTRPQDDLLELVVIHSAVQAKMQPYNQSTAMEHVMSLLARFNELQIVWPAVHYNKSDIPDALLCQCPLVMDPGNPFINLADSQTFQPDELMTFTRSAPFGC